MNSSLAARFNADLLDENFARWQDDPTSVDPSWAAFFDGFALGMAQAEGSRPGGNGPTAASPVAAPPAAPPVQQDPHASASPTGGESLRITQIDPGFRAHLVSMIYNYRLLGHTEAWTDPLGLAPPVNPALSLE
ncbi:MAG: hypothetical protein GY953_05905, partial [bacterium]|nr:hypothetical protein [bacterium]